MSVVGIGDIVWVCDWSGKTGPFPAVVIDTPNGQALTVVPWWPNIGTPITVTPWTFEDGTAQGWLEIPADKQVPADLFF